RRSFCVCVPYDLLLNTEETLFGGGRNGLRRCADVLPTDRTQAVRRLNRAAIGRVDRDRVASDADAGAGRRSASATIIGDAQRKINGCVEQFPTCIVSRCRGVVL